MKVLLINPPACNGMWYVREGRCQQRVSSYEYVFPPISLFSIAAVLEKENFEVKIIDCTAERITFTKLENIIKKESPDMIVISISTPTFYEDIKLAELVKKLGIFVVAIGIHCSALPEQTLLESSFDAVVRGEPEITVLEIARRIKKEKNLKNVLGVSFKNNGKVYNNKPRPFIKDLDSLPFPARHLVDNKKYLFPFSKESWTLVTANRGCPHKCIFCNSFLYYGRSQRFRSPQSIVDEIEEVVSCFGIKNIGMWGEIFTSNRKFLVNVCNEIKKRNLDIKWYIASRVDTLDSFKVKKLVSAGCKALTLGVESASQKILDNAKKGITVRQSLRAIKLCKKFGLEVQAHVMFGLPGENKKTAEKTIKFIKMANPNYVNFYCAVPFPGTEFFDYVSKNRFLITKDWSKFEINNAVISYPDFTAEDIQETRRRAFIEFYLRPSKIFEILSKYELHEYLKIIRSSMDFLSSWVFK